MRLETQLLTRNDCYRAGRTIIPKGVMVHSTGANNPWVSRYVPGNEVLGYNTGGNHWDQTNAESEAKFGKKLSKCVHAFVGKFADGNGGVVQTLPWNWRGWHAGGSANNTHISFEICEDGLEDASYFKTVYQLAVELTAMLCKQFGLDPLADGVVICHSEGYKRGVASNHADVMHWFPKHGKTMDDFRADVAREMEEGEKVTQEQFDAMMDNWLSRRAGQSADGWAADGLAEAKAKGLFDGSRPQSFATRQEVALMVLAGSTVDKP